MTSIFAPHALLPDGWASDVRLDWDTAGVLRGIERNATRHPDVPFASGPVIPGMPNLHSHAFQRAFAGLTEVRGGANTGDGDDSFWTWRELMYGYALAVTPAMLEAIATHLYIRMLQGGYTSVCEFHYVHNDVDGKPYADDATMSRALLTAARRAGIGLTLLPVLYRHNGFRGVPPRAEQRRFVRDVDSVLALVEALRRDIAGPRERVGFAAHSLRAVSPDSLAAALDALRLIDATMPIHVHVAEQRREVDECVAALGQRPVAWLVDHVAVDARWCLVHATHMDDAECAAAARTGAVAGLCPTTEANLGDGTFDLPRWRDAGGSWGIGSDSHICVDAGLELAMLEYSQRLATGRRNVGADRREPWVATAMTMAAVAGGARATGRDIGGLAVGASADFAVLDARHPVLAGLDAPGMLSAAVFASDRANAVRDVYVGGECRIRDGRHAMQDAADAAFVDARRALASAAATGR
jgi:formimidoylglutamate deiminase